jgi:hypothetical protein
LSLIGEWNGQLEDYLVKFLRACLGTGYVPAIWSQVKEVFIPKPSRNSYSGPRDVRPISLKSFLLKTMERLVDRFSGMNFWLLCHYIPINMYTRLGNLWKWPFINSFGWKRHLTNQKTAICVFLDKERAFNNTSYDSMCAAFFKHVVNYTIVWWMRVILEGCLAAATLSGYS